MLKKLFLSLVLAAATLTSLHQPAHAAEAGDVVVSINPSEQELTLRPGDHAAASVTVYNVGREAFNFEVSAAPYQTKNNDYDADFTTENAHTRLSNWITFPETKFHLEPDHAVAVEFEIDVPADALGGGQYAAIIIQTEPKEESDGAIKVIPQLAALLYGHVSGAEMNEDGEMINHHFPSFILGDDFRFYSTFKNTGNVDFRVTETLTIRNFFTNQEVMTPASVSESGYNIGTTSAAVLPGTERTISQSWPSAPQLGIFRVKQTVSFLDQDLVFEKVVIVCPLWLIVLIGLFVLLIIVWIISHFASRRREKPQVF